MTIFLGPAGIPHSSKGSSTIEGIKQVAELGLNAMEIEFVRSVYLNGKSAIEVGDVSKEYGVRLSIHAPYFINLCSKNKETIEASKERIIKSAKIGEILGADAIAIHSAYYSGMTSEQTIDMLHNTFLELSDKLHEIGVKKTKLGVEVMGRESAFGSLEEVVELCRKVNNKQIVPYLDFGHSFVRDNGKIDYGDIFDKLKPLKLDHINSQFTGVKFNEKTKKFVDVHEPIGKPQFEPLAKEILKRKLDITIICESPLLEIDSLKMKQILGI